MRGEEGDCVCVVEVGPLPFFDRRNFSGIFLQDCGTLPAYILQEPGSSFCSCP